MVLMESKRHPNRIHRTAYNSSLRSAGRDGGGTHVNRGLLRIRRTRHATTTTMPPARLLAVLAVIPLISARLLHSLPEDTYAFPKYKVSFLSQLPLANKTAEHWLKHGLTGGLSEFLDQPSSSHKRISSNDDDDHSEPQPYSDYTLEHMRMGHNDSYLCLIPKALDPPVSTTPEPELDISPAHSWSLLEPLNGNCLYVRPLPVFH